MIVDASVASHWFVETEFSAAAAPFRMRDDLVAPGFLLLETANMLYKRCRGGEMAAEDLAPALCILQALMAELVPDHNLLPEAVALAVDVQTPVYDCLYIALATSRDDSIVTADRRLAAVARGKDVAVDLIVAG